MKNNTKQVLSIIAALFSFAAIHTSAAAAPEDYDPNSGEPKCVKCHTPENRYFIDYTRDDSCIACHGPGLSDRYISINKKFRKEIAEADSAKSTDAANTEAAPEKESAPSEKKAARGTQGMVHGMVLIPAGEFTMGSNDWWPKSQPEHKKKLKAYYIDKYEVTNADYQKYVRAAGAQPPDHWINGKIPTGKEKHPVVWVTWYDAENYCKWAGKRLPAEAEWEKAARGTDKRTFPWGDDAKHLKDWANTPQMGRNDTMPVGSFEKGKSPYGLYDMAGNAFEWTADWYKPYPGSSHPQDENFAQNVKALRGGSWYDCTTYKCGISSPTYNRISFNPTTKNSTFGFRCAKDK